MRVFKLALVFTAMLLAVFPSWHGMGQVAARKCFGLGRDFTQADLRRRFKTEMRRFDPDRCSVSRRQMQSKRRQFSLA
eukprot:11228355-Lingulodinium_polyedra.AAC.3